MSTPRHSYEGCVRAYHALAEAASTVTRRLEQGLADSVALRISEFDVLVALGDATQPPLMLSDLADNVRLSQSAISRLVERLEHRGLLVRETGTDDRRSVLVRLSSAGNELLERAIPVHAACVDATLLDRLTPREQEALKTILIKIVG